MVIHLGGALLKCWASWVLHPCFRLKWGQKHLCLWGTVKYCITDTAYFLVEAKANAVELVFLGGSSQNGRCGLVVVESTSEMRRDVLVGNRKHEALSAGCSWQSVLLPAVTLAESTQELRTCLPSSDSDSHFLWDQRKCSNRNWVLSRITVF